MSNVRRKDILTNLKTRLEEITTDNGYTYDIIEVSYDLKNYTEMAEHELPAIFILPDTETQTGGVGGRYQRTFVIDLFIVAKCITYQELADIVDDIEECLVGVGGSGAGLECTINVPRIVDVAFDNQGQHDTDQYALGVVTVELDYVRSSHRPV